jgi:hypothetical protein
MKPNSRDELSAFYYIRTLDLEPGMTLELPNCDGEINRTFKVDVIRREEITTELGTFNTLVVDVTLDETASLLFAGKTKATIWLRDDASRMILKLSSSFILGEIKAEITSVEME